MLAPVAVINVDYVALTSEHFTKHGRSEPGWRSGSPKDVRWKGKFNSFGAMSATALPALPATRQLTS